MITLPTAAPAFTVPGDALQRSGMDEASLTSMLTGFLATAPFEFNDARAEASRASAEFLREAMLHLAALEGALGAAAEAARDAGDTSAAVLLFSLLLGTLSEGTLSSMAVSAEVYAEARDRAALTAERDLAPATPAPLADTLVHVVSWDAEGGVGGFDWYRDEETANMVYAARIQDPGHAGVRLTSVPVVAGETVEEITDRLDDLYFQEDL